MQRVLRWAAATGVGVLTTFYVQPAEACGGCFLPPSERPTVVTSHRMAVSISTTRTILWDQIQYDGAPQEFAWVLPVQPGATLELGSDAFFEALDGATQVNITAPQLNCSGGTSVGFGCPSESLSVADSAAGGGGGVTVLHHGTVGPYETVTLRATQPNALVNWLTTNNFNIDATIAPVIDAYVQEESDFIALRLRPGADVSQMKPVRVVYAGPMLSFPLRMVAAGTGSEVGLTLFILGEGRWSAGNAQNVTITDADLSWDFGASRSNYTEQREAALAANEGNAWLTTYAKQGTLFAPTVSRANFGGQDFYVASNGNPASTIAELYAAQAEGNGEGEISDCVGTFSGLSQRQQIVVDPCESELPESCRALTADEIDYRTLKCGNADDLAAALVGMRPASVWVTRLEAELPRSALSADLVLAAAEQQQAVDNNLLATRATNVPSGCTVAGTVQAQAEAKARSTQQLASLLSIFAPLAVGMTILRRVSRRQRKA